jgi:hypothetical protein
VLATYRTDELTRDHPLWTLLPEWCRQGADRLLLARMTLDEMEEMATLWMGDKREEIPSVARAVHRRSQGVALFARELLEHYQASGTLDPGHLPDTLLQALDSRLARLPAAARRILDPAAVIGERFSFDLLDRAVGDTDSDALGALLSEAVRFRILRPDPDHEAAGDHYVFDHGLVREAVLAGMSVSDRRRWHTRVAEAMESLGGFEADAVSYHWTRAGDPRAVEGSISAGDRALELGATAQAESRYRAALERAGDAHPKRAEILLKLGYSLRWTSMETAEQAFGAALRQAERLGQRSIAV